MPAAQVESAYYEPLMQWRSNVNSSADSIFHGMFSEGLALSGDLQRKMSLLKHSKSRLLLLIPCVVSHQVCHITRNANRCCTCTAGIISLLTHTCLSVALHIVVPSPTDICTSVIIPLEIANQTLQPQLLRFLQIL